VGERSQCLLWVNSCRFPRANDILANRVLFFGVAGRQLYLRLSKPFARIDYLSVAEDTAAWDGNGHERVTDLGDSEAGLFQGFGNQRY
jgi:hypothetical protein